jgi:hypothetical protein
VARAPPRVSAYCRPGGGFLGVHPHVMTMMMMMMMTTMVMIPLMK